MSRWIVKVLRSFDTVKSEFNEIHQESLEMNKISRIKWSGLKVGDHKMVYTGEIKRKKSFAIAREKFRVRPRKI